MRAEFLRPREWVERNGIVAGASLPIAISELEIEGNAFVTSITACPPVAEGPGRVVTGRFVTWDAGNLVRVTLENGTEIRATDVHPIWSVDGEEWIPAGELVPGELVDTLTGPVAVESVERLHSGLDVYNIEVHGEHVFRVTADGVLVHNACASTSGNNAAARLGQVMHTAYKAGLADNVNTFKEYLIKTTGNKIDFLDIANGIVYELKPNNARAIARGVKQAERYVAELEKLFPGSSWEIIIDRY